MMIDDHPISLAKGWFRNGYVTQNWLGRHEVSLRGLLLEMLSLSLGMIKEGVPPVPLLSLLHLPDHILCDHLAADPRIKSTQKAQPRDGKSWVIKKSFDQGKAMNSF